MTRLEPAADRLTTGSPRPAAFLDRDGVINLDHGYVWRPADLAFTPTAVDGIRLLNEHDYLVLVVSNQSGVARGYFGLEEMDAFNAGLNERLLEAGASIDRFYCCPYHPAGRVPSFARDHADRKPQPGMIHRAMSEWPIDPARSFMIGDKASDMEAAAAAGIRGTRVPTNTCDLAAVIRAEMNRPQ